MLYFKPEFLSNKNTNLNFQHNVAKIRLRMKNSITLLFWSSLDARSRWYVRWFTRSRIYTFNFPSFAWLCIFHFLYFHESCPEKGTSQVQMDKGQILWLVINNITQQNTRRSLIIFRIFVKICRYICRFIPSIFLPSRVVCISMNHVHPQGCARVALICANTCTPELFS